MKYHIAETSVSSYSPIINILEEILYRNVRITFSKKTKTLLFNRKENGSHKVSIFDNKS